MLNFDRIKYKLHSGTVIGELRGKQCGQLLTKDNFSRFSKVKTEDFSQYEILSCDITKDIYIGQEKDNYLSKLALIPFNNLQVTPYKNKQSGQLQSIVIHTKTKQRGQQTIRLTIYDKYAESADPNYLGFIRLEYRITTFDRLRKALNIPNNNLHNVLTAEVNPIDFLLTSIYNKIDESMRKEPIITDFTEQLYHSYFTDLEYNWQTIKDRLKLTGQSPHKIRKVKDLFIKLTAERKAVNYKQLFSPLITEQTEQVKAL